MNMKLKLSVLMLLISVSVSAQKKIKDSVAYALGIQIATNLKQNQIVEQVNIKELASAVDDVKKGKTRLTPEQSDSVIRVFLTKRYEMQKAKNEREGKDFYRKNSITQGIVTLQSGLQYRIEREGTGAKPSANDEVEVNYKGTLLDGRVFDSSYERGQSVKFPLSRVIPGWTEGLQHIGEGGKIMLFIPSKLAYGEAAPPGSIIEPNSTLIFEVELLKIFPAAATDK